MAKHISEGQVPPIHYYGQQYVGSLGSHIYALVFGVFGYSTQAAEAVSLLIYLGFIAVQYFFFKNIFSAAWAAVLSIFYSLPLWHLIVIGLDTSNPFSLVLFLQAAILYTAYAIAYKNKARLWPLLGFLMGLSFWTHQITAAAIMTGLLVVAFKTKFEARRYGQLLFYGLAGGFPLVLNEIFHRFQILRFLLREGETTRQPGKLKATLEMVRSLLFFENRPARTFFLFFLLAGLVVFSVLAFKKRGTPPGRVFILFFIVFSGMYALSGFSARLLPRYLFPLYLCIPVFLAAPFLWIKHRLRYAFPLVLLAGLLALDSGPAYSAYYHSTQTRHRFFEETIAAMAGTGNRFWQAEYWTAYLFTALSGERLIVDAYSSNRYLPYRLMYYDRKDRDHYVFCGNPDQALGLERLLAGLGIPFNKKVIGECTLLYGIEGPVFPDVLDEAPPSQIPDLEIEQVQSRAGYLELTFNNKARQESSSFRLNVEIPGWSSMTRVFPGSAESITVRIPHPRIPSFSVRYYLDYHALKIPSTVREFPWSFQDKAPERSPEAFIYLRGISPVIHFAGKDLRYCEKEIVLEVNPPPGKKAGLRIVLNSPFDISDSNWHGDYSQHLRIGLNGEQAAERKLQTGINRIELDLPAGEQRPVLLTMSFRYRSFFDPISLRTFSATLEGLEIID